MKVTHWMVLGAAVVLALQSAPLPAQSALKLTVPIPDGTTVQPVKLGDEQAVTLQPAEQVAFLFVYGIWNLQNRLLDKDMGGIGRLASLRELVKGVQTDGGVIGLSADPAKDINYGYDVMIIGRDCVIRAIPRKPGLSALALLGSPERMMGNFYYSPGSSDFAKGVKLTEMGYGGNGFIRQ